MQKISKAIPMTAVLGLQDHLSFTLNLQFCLLLFVQMRTYVFSQVSSAAALIIPFAAHCASPLHPEGKHCHMPGHSLGAIQCTLAGPSGLWVSTCGQGTAHITFTCLLTVLTLGFHFVYHLNHSPRSAMYLVGHLVQFL